MRAPHAGHRVTAVLAGALMAGAAFATPALAAAPKDAPATGVVTAEQTKAAYPKGKVVSRLPLSIRERPTTDSAYLGSFEPGTVVSLRCKVHNQNVDGNDLWYKLSERKGWVAARYVKNLSYVPYCK
ncbi:SH3 domain-containing protein [Streptomyces sp. NPDC007088]|uniref:SH3 domain-containing protein n=1 Tax=Streptomyces sp. NPDC007088 TaxID=3364773 RepID=UPI0036A66E3E